jgi:hypothetical protein
MYIAIRNAIIFIKVFMIIFLRIFPCLTELIYLQKKAGGEMYFYQNSSLPNPA